MCNIGGFSIANFDIFKKSSFKNISITTDGTYLYIYDGSTNGI